MDNKKRIRDLTNTTTAPQNTDFLVLDNGTTNKITRANLLAGTPLPADTVDTQAMVDGAVNSAKLADAFFKGRYKNSETISSETGLTVQFGWDFIEGEGTNFLQKSISYPTTWTSLFMVNGSYAGVKTSAGAPTSLNSANTSIGSNTVNAYARPQNNSAFILSFNRDGATMGSGNFWMASWVAIGIV